LLKRELDLEIAMKRNKIYVIPDFMLDTMTDESFLKIQQVLVIAGYKPSASRQLKKLIKNGDMPEPTIRSLPLKNPTPNLWRFSDVKAFVEMHNKSIRQKKLKENQIYCPICKEVLTAINETYDEEYGWIFCHKEIEHDNSDIEALDNKIQ
jgi:hypothetical protein